MNMWRKYFFNCFLFTIPILVWDLLFTEKLPPAYQASIFWENIPPALSIGENVSRIILFLLMALMPISIHTKTASRGLPLYIAGIAVYFTAWLVLIYRPEQAWSVSVTGFMAPAYTPLVWLTGIGMIGEHFYFRNIKVKWVYYAVALVFLLLHNYHTYIIFTRTH